MRFILANIFKSLTLSSVGTVPQTLYQCPLSTTSIIIGATAANKIGNSVKATVSLQKEGAGSTVDLVTEADVPVGAALAYMTGNKLVLESGDSLLIFSDTPSSVDSILSILEIT